MLRIRLGDFVRRDDVQIFAVQGRTGRKVVAPHDRHAAIDDERLLVRDPGAVIDPYRDAGRGERADAFLARARRQAIGDEAHVNTPVMGADQGRGEPGPVGQHIGADKDLSPRGINGADGEPGAILFRREIGNDARRTRPKSEG
jgi:hypothetical protein